MTESVTVVITLDSERLEKLKKLRRAPEQEYQDLITRLIDEADDDNLSSEELEYLSHGLDDIKNRRINSAKKVRKFLDLDDTA